jgi:hypothetical protein
LPEFEGSSDARIQGSEPGDSRSDSPSRPANAP